MDADHVDPAPGAKRVRRTNDAIDAVLSEKGIFSDPCADGTQRYRCEHCQATFGPDRKAYASWHDCPSLKPVPQDNQADGGGVFGSEYMESPLEWPVHVDREAGCLPLLIPECTEDWAATLQPSTPEYYTTSEADLIAAGRESAVEAEYEV